MYERLFSLQEDVFKTLANQKRLEIVQLLSRGELSVSEMVDMLGIAQSNLSQHLSVLRNQKLVTTRKQGLQVYYHLSDARIGEVVTAVREFLRASYKHDPDITAIESIGQDSTYPIIRDPVCGMRMSASEASDSFKNNGRQYYFCASGCKEKFVSNPNAYVNKTNKELVHG